MTQQREIRFRAWDSHLKRMSGLGIGTGLGDDNRNLHLVSDKPLMQFTGLYDKAGTEIYESDIVKGGFGDDLAEIRFGMYKPVMNTDQWEGHQSFYVHWIDEEKRNYTRGDLGYWLQKMETQIVVIGNIYSNPELLS